jgi:Skp family chaperone for outer membrane proteins
LDELSQMIVSKKNNMRKKLFLVSSLIWVMVMTAAAQGGMQNMTPEDAAKRQTDMIVKSTGCDAATKAKVEAITLKYAKELATVREKYTDREARREPMKAIRDKQDAELKGVLTADQYAKLKAAQEEMRKNYQNNGGGGAPR